MSDHRRADARILQNVLVEELVGNKDKLESLFRDVSTAEFGRFQSSRVLRVPNQQDMRLDDVMLSLWTLDLPFALLVRSNEKESAFWLLVESTANEQDGRTETVDAVEAIFQSKCPGLIFDPPNSARASRELLATAGRSTEYGAMLTGIPTRRSRQIDEILRSMRGEDCWYLVVAMPLRRDVLQETEQILMEEIGSLMASGDPNEGEADMDRDPYLRESVRGLSIDLERVRLGETSGMWNVSVYVGASSGSGYAKLAAIMKGSLTGPKSFPEPIRITSVEGDLLVALRQLVEHPAVLILRSAPDSIGIFTSPSLRTPMTSEELAIVSGFPDEEVAGLEVYTPPKYSVNTSTASGERSITLGEIVDRIQPTGNILSMNADNLVKHGFVVGQTGYGKTRAVIHLLKELNRIRIPWLVIDPVGEEYRALIGEDDNANVRLFSLGAKNGGGFRFNPFDVPPKVSVQSHIEMVTSVLEMAFSMYTVLPQLLQLAVIGAYQKKGWDMAESAQTDKPPPTLTDLYLTVREMRIDYPAQTTSELRQALLTRIRGLMLGSKGKVLNCQRSVKMDDLLSGPAILELEGIQDPNDKAIVMGLLFGTVAEYVRSNSDYSGTLKHVVVLEEAHNILPNIETDVNNAFQGHPKAKMVETMSNMLAEMRKHGEGIMIVNQIPSELSSRAVKNTNMSLIFRTKDSRDKQMLADSINLTEDQRDFLSNLMPGEAVCFMEDLHHPVMIQVTKTEAKMPSEQEVLKRIQEFNAQHAEIMEAAPRPFVGCELCEEACAHFLDSEAAFMRVLRDQKKLVKVIDYSNKGNFQALAGLIGTELTRLGFKQASIYKTYCFYVQLLNYTEYSTDDRESQIRSSARQFKAYLTSR